MIKMTIIPPAATTALLAVAMLFASIGSVHAQTADFNISAIPVVTCVNPGGATYYSTTVSSVGNFQGRVSLGDTIDPSSANSPTVAIPSSVLLGKSQTVTFYANVSTTKATHTGLYVFNIVGETGALFHYTTVWLQVESVCGTVGGTIIPSTSIGPIVPLAMLGTGLAGLVSGTAFLYLRRSRIH